MKRVLSLVLVLVMVLGAIMPAFAEVSTTAAASQEATDLVTYGVIAGTDEGLEEDAVLTRAQFTVILSQLYKMKETAMVYPFEATFTDLEEGAWYVPYVAYAEAQNWMSGMGDGTFNPNGNMTAQQVNAMYVKALGYTAEWADVNTKAAELGVDVTAADTTAVLRGEAFKSLRGMLDVPMMGETDTLGTTLALAAYVAPAPAVTDLEIVSVASTNHKEIVVTFNNELDSDTVIPANFTVDAATTVSLADDNKTVTVTLDDADALVTQPLEVTLTVSDVADLNESVVAETSYELTLLDVVVPTVQSVELTGPQTFEITFSEPIKVAPTVKVEAGIYGSTVSALTGSNVVEVTLSASQLNDGDYDIAVSGYEDYAGIAGGATTLTLVYAEDTSIPTASITSATQTEVVVEFDRAVTLDATVSYVDYFYHTFSAWAPDSVVVAGAECTLTFTTYPIPEGDFTLVVDYNGDNAVVIVDEWGNEVAGNITLTDSVTADLTAPEITKVVVVDEGEVEVYYSEAVAGAATKASFTVLDADEAAVTVATATYAVTADDEYVTTLTFSPDLDGGFYTVEVADVTDTSLAENALAVVTNSFEVTDLTPIVVASTAVEYVIDGTASVMYVTYPEKMAVTGQYSVLEASNYLIAVAGTYAELGSDATLEAFGSTDKVVKITLPATALTAASTVQIARVADLAGNLTTELAFVETMTAVTAPTVTAILVTGTNKATITIDKPLSVVLASGFKTSSGAIAAIDTWSVNSDNETIVEITVISADALSATDTEAVFAKFTVVADILVAETGIKMAVADYSGLLATADGRSPEFDTLTVTDLSNFVLNFTEDFDVMNNTLVATDLVITDADGDALVAGTDYTVVTSVTGTIVDTITVTLTTAATAADVYTIASIAAPNYLLDAAGNVVDAFDAQDIEF